MSQIKSCKQLVDEANAHVEVITVDQARAMQGDTNVQFVDVRDIRELSQFGKVTGAYHAPRGMLEFWIDPASPYFKKVFAGDKKFVFYCKSGWRSALATKSVQDMGLTNVCHIDGGFDAWSEAGAEVEQVE